MDSAFLLCELVNRPNGYRMIHVGYEPLECTSNGNVVGLLLRQHILLHVMEWD